MEDDSRRRGGQDRDQEVAVNSPRVLTSSTEARGNNRPGQGEVSRQPGGVAAGRGRASGSRDSHGCCGSPVGDHVIHTGAF